MRIIETALLATALCVGPALTAQSTKDTKTSDPLSASDAEAFMKAHPKLREEIKAQADKNKDGKLSAEERALARRMFESRLKVWMEARRADRKEKREDHKEARQERREDRKEKVEERRSENRDERHDRVDARRADLKECWKDRREKAEERRGEHRDERHDRVEARREDRKEKVEVRRDRVETRREDRKEKVEERRDERSERRKSDGPAPQSRGAAGRR